MNLTTRRRTSFTSLVLILSFLFTTAPAQAAQPNSSEPVDLQMVTRIRQEGFRNSKVMELAQELTDVHGQRLTGSPSLKRSQQWAQQQMEQWGLKNAAQVPYAFGRGWQLDDFRIRMVAPDVVPLLAYPKAWTPATNGVIRGAVVKARLTTSADLEKFRGQLAGKIVITGDLREIRPGEKPALNRYSDEQLTTEVFQYEIPRARPTDREAYQRLREFRRTLNQFLVDEKALAVIDASRGDAGLIYVQGGGSHRPTEPIGPPSLVMDVSSYGRISRLIDKKVPVELELEIKSRFLEEDQNALNTVAEIPGGDKASEVVIAGAHIDSWHGSTGATDNAAGVAVVMEAARILQALGVKPRRTIRIALWTGEEQGLLGARAYIAQKYAERTPAAQGQAESRQPRPLQLKAEHANVAAYFNYDNGTGKVRGMYTEENAAVVPIFQAWLKPFADLGATVVSNRRNPGSDHDAFDEVGLPGFQFVQDDIEYGTRTHHSMADSFERLQREDLMQAAVIMASFIYHAAMRDEMLPRKPLPKEAVPAPEPVRAVEKKPAGKKK